MKTHTVNGFEVPPPMVETPKYMDGYSYPVLDDKWLAISNTWHGMSLDIRVFDRGLCFETVEDARKNALAMLGINPNTDIFDTLPTHTTGIT